MISAIQADPNALTNLYALKADPQFSDPALQDLIEQLIALMNPQPATAEAPPSETPANPNPS